MSSTKECDCDDLSIVVGSQRVFNVDLTTDGGLPGGVAPSDVTLSAFDDLANVDVSGTVVAGGIALSVNGNVATIKVKADERRARVLVTMTYTNPLATPGKQRWEFAFI